MTSRTDSTNLLIAYAISCCDGKIFSRDDSSISITYTVHDSLAKRRVLCMLYVLLSEYGTPNVWARQITKTEPMPQPFLVGTLGDMRIMRDIGAFDALEEVAR